MKMIYRGVLLIFIFFILFYFNIINGDFFNDWNEIQNKNCIDYLKSENWSGIIFKKYIDTKNHNIKVIELKRSNEVVIRRFTLSCYDQSFFNQIEIGDSIYRGFGEFNCYIISKRGFQLFRPKFPQ